MFARPWFPLSLTLVLSLVSASTSAAPVPNVIPTSSPVWTGENPLPATTTQDDYGYSIAAAGDVNGDGFGDVLVGAPSWNLSRGRTLLYLGSAGGLSNAPAWILEGSEEGGILGNFVAGAGDVNHDGYADILIGEPGAQGGRGRVRLFLGSRRGPRSLPFWDQYGNADEGLGSTVAFAGDVNGDRYDDVLVGSAAMFTSSVRLYFGRPGHLDRDPAWVISGSYMGDGIGDVNGDGFADIAVQPNGTTAVFHGSRQGLSSTASWTGPWGAAFSGRGEVNGDGYGDLILGPPGGSGVHLYLGSAVGLSLAPAWNAADGSGDFGQYVSIAGDVNGDGISDIAVSAPRHMEGLTLAPSVLVYLGTHSLPSTAPSWRGTNGLQSFLRPVALGADVDHNGSSEVLFADPVSSGGRVYLYSLGPAYPAPFIIHDASVVTVPTGTALVLEADILDNTHSVARGEIVYRFVEDFGFQPPIVMEHVTGNRYRGTIPAPVDFHSGLVYSIQGVDDYGLVGATELIGVDYGFEAAPLARLEPRIVSAFGTHGVRIQFTTMKSGPARIRIFDVAGRLIATVLDTRALGPGEHRVEVEERVLPRSGVYFYRIETTGGAASGRLVRVR